MNKLEKNECVLTLNHLIFDDIMFQRRGFPNENELKFSVGFDFGMQGDRKFTVHINVCGEKAEEYEFQVTASGYFVLDSDSDQDQELIIRQNAAAIIFPYIRSQISLLTAQPEMAPVVLPPLNIAQLVEDAMRRDDETI